ncbi:ROK family transcriptional regulator [Streptomyces sp. NBC_01304]|uniref:ROK family transcriptional regulator n=1 Tax=Streptomyces sp. NBC_01304 TaxID=2903818 RepID=UPI002E0F05BE|nr:ROK family transcriptional regulator [Streptomyces sp. NBC_01304]
MTAAAQPPDIRRANLAAALRTVLDEGPVPRSDLAARLGLSHATISRIVGRAVAAGLLRELPSVSGGGGRPKVPVDLVADARLTIGLYFGRQRTTAGLVDLRGQVREVATIERGPGSAAELLPGAAGLVRTLLKRARSTPVLGVGAAAGGWVDPTAGVVVDNEALGWRDVPLRRLLEDATGLPVRVDAGARAHATAELWFGGERTEGCSVHLFTGNVIDAAIAMGRRVHTGARSGAGAVGHLPVREGGPACACGRTGVLQAVAADSAVLTQAVERELLGPGAGLEALATLALSGSREADGLLRARARHIGTAVAHLVDLLDPDLVVLSGGVLAVPDHLEEVRREAVLRIGRGWDPRVVRATGLGPGPQALVASSAALLLSAYFADPMAYETLS